MITVSRTKQFLYLVFGGGLAQLSSFMVTAILARKLSDVDYGTYRQVLLVSALIIPIFSSAIPNSLLYFLPRLKTEGEKIAFVQRTLLLLMGFGFFTSMTMAAFSGLIAEQFSNSSLQNYLILGCLYPALTLSSSYVVPLMIALNKARLSVVYSSITSFFNLIVVSIVANAVGSIDSIIVAIVFTAACSFMVSLYLSNKHLKIFSQSGKHGVSLKEQFLYAAPLGLASVISIWGLKLDQAIVSSYFDVATFAVYSVGAMEFPVVELLSSSIYSVLFPEVSWLMAEGKKNEVLELWKRTVEKSMLLIMPVFGAALIISHQLITSIYTKKYEASVPIFQIYLFLIPIRTINFGLLLRSIGKTQYDLYGSVLFMVTNLAFALFTIKMLGIYGPTLSMVVSVCILACYHLFMIRREIGYSYGEVLNLTALLPILFMTAVLPIILLIISFSNNLKEIISPSIILFSYIIIISLFYKGSGKWSKLQSKRA